MYYVKVVYKRNNVRDWHFQREHQKRGDRTCVQKHNNRNVSGREHGDGVLSDALYSDKKAFFVKVPEFYIEICAFLISGSCATAKILYYVGSERTFSGC